MTDELDRLRVSIDDLEQMTADEITRLLMPNGREAYVQDFERRFGLRLDQAIDAGAEIDRQASAYWQNAKSPPAKNH